MKYPSRATQARAPTNHFQCHFFVHHRAIACKCIVVFITQGCSCKPTRRTRVRLGQSQFLFCPISKSSCLTGQLILVWVSRNFGSLE